ncbi:MAG: hypothetical protein Q8R29_00405 [bacterium]|nr:hypothetical protein [bacterium]
MLNILHDIEIFVLSLLLRNHARWKSMLINYNPPTVERLWTQFGKYRVNLHRINLCKREDALFHPHPWPSAVRILSGSYKMDIGYGKGEKEPPVASTLIMAEGSAYEMIDPDGWHRIYPVCGSSISLMVTGSPWARSSPGKGRSFPKLGNTEQLEILGFFLNYYPRVDVDLQKQKSLLEYVADKLGMSVEDLQRAL